MTELRLHVPVPSSHTLLALFLGSYASSETEHGQQNHMVGREVREILSSAQGALEEVLTFRHVVKNQGGERLM
jgi:hypothetical protein